MPSEVLVFRKRLESIEEAIRNIAVGGAPVAVAAAAAPVDDAVITDLIKRISDLESVAAPVAAPVDDAVIAELTKRISDLEAVPAPAPVAAPVADAVIAELTERIAKLEAMNAPLSAEEKKGMGLEVAESDVEDSEAEAEATA